MPDIIEQARRKVKDFSRPLAPVADGALSSGIQSLADFLLLDDAEALANAKESPMAAAITAASMTPIGKGMKTAKRFLNKETLSLISPVFRKNELKRALKENGGVLKASSNKGDDITFVGADDKVTHGDLQAAIEMAGKGGKTAGARLLILDERGKIRGYFNGKPISRDFAKDFGLLNLLDLE